MTHLQDRPVLTRARRSHLWLLAAAGIAVVALLVLALWSLLRPEEPAAPEPAERPERDEPPPDVETTFNEDSYWHTPLPVDAERHPQSDDIIAFLRETNFNEGCVRLSGAGDDPWGMPIYHAGDDDPVVSVEETDGGFGLPEEFSHLRIAVGAQPMGTEDAEMVIFDDEQGFVASLHGAAWLFDEGTWTAAGGSVAYYDSNGLDQSLPESDDPRNWSSHRGLNGAVMAVRHDLVLEGYVPYVLKVGVTESSPEDVFPMTDSDGTSEHPIAPPQGTRLRIRPDVDLDRFELAPEAHVIASALQHYGMIIGDSTTGPIELKLERPVVEVESPWEIAPDAICSIPIDAFEVIDHDYQRALAGS